MHPGLRAGKRGRFTRRKSISHSIGRAMTPTAAAAAAAADAGCADKVPRDTVSLSPKGVCDRTGPVRLSGAALGNDTRRRRIQVYWCVKVVRGFNDSILRLSAPRQMSVNNLPRVVTQPRPDRESNRRPLGRKSDAQPLRRYATRHKTPPHSSLRALAIHFHPSSSSSSSSQLPSPLFRRSAPFIPVRYRGNAPTRRFVRQIVRDH